MPSVHEWLIWPITSQAKRAMLGEALCRLYGYWVKESAEMDILLLFENIGYFVVINVKKTVPYI